MRTGIVRAVQLFLGRCGNRRRADRSTSTSSTALLVLGVSVLGGVFVLDDVDAHVGQRGHHVLDLLGTHLVLREGLVQLVIGQPATLLRLGDQPLQAGLVEIDDRCAIGFSLLGRFTVGNAGFAMPVLYWFVIWFIARTGCCPSRRIIVSSKGSRSPQAITVRQGGDAVSLKGFIPRFDTDG
jgi:hypothetical protein